MGQLETCCDSTQPVQRPTLTNRLEGQKEELENKLKQVNEVLTMLEKSPETQQVLDAVYKLGMY